MTSMNMSVLPSGPPERNYQVAKSESPPLNEGVNSPFRESLEKAMAADEQSRADSSSSAREKAEAVREKQSGRNSEAIENPSAEESAKEKTSHLEPKRIGKRDTGETLLVHKKVKAEGEAESVHEDSALNLLQSGEKNQIKAGKGELLFRKRRSESGRIEKTESAGVETVQGKELQESASSLIGQTDVPDKSKGALKKADRGEGAERNVVIPFPSAGESSLRVSENASQNMTSQETNAAKTAKGSVSGRKAGKEEPVLTVVDARSKSVENRESPQTVTKTAMVTESVDQTNREGQAIVLGEQNGPSASDDIKSFESRFNENREVMLARELRESGNDQIVKKASFVLKDNNQGEIKLILKPEALGRVKIHLNMNENNLVGKIIVENNRVGQIFENNLNNLSKAFEEAGLGSSSLEVSVGDGNGHKESGNQPFQKDQPFFSERLKTLDHAVPTVERAASGQGIRLVNLVV